MSCPNCGWNVIEHDSASGSSFCTNCGVVLEENAIVAEVTFGEASNGSAYVQGSYVGANQGNVLTSGRFRRHNALASRQQSLFRGRRQIQIYATRLSLPERYVEAAQRYYNLAVNNNFISGRRIDVVSSVCLYIVCRLEKSYYMLIDFSDIMNVNVFILGATFLKLVQVLHLPLPLVDPSFYIQRFASMLDFGDKTGAVVTDALRLVQSMDRDWMVRGRRPAGICGASLMLAAQMHNLERSFADIVRVVKVCDATVRKRLNEFGETPSSKLTIADFRTIWLEEACDPPSFHKQKPKPVGKEPAASKAKQGDKAEGDDDEDELLRREINKYLENEELRLLATRPNENFDEDVTTWTDIDDDEIVNVILNEEEVQAKTDIWMTENEDWLKVQERKMSMKKASNDQGEQVPKKRRKYQQSRPAEPAATAKEATDNLIVVKKLSKKINREAMKDLFKR